MQCCEALSPQEQRIYEEMQGRKSIRGGRDRAYAISETFKGKKPVIDIERARYFTESIKQTEGQPLVLRWAKALKHIAENITVYIDDNQLIVGRAGQPGRYGILYPELDGDFLDLSIEQLPRKGAVTLRYFPGRCRCGHQRDFPLLEGEDLPRKTGRKPSLKRR